MTEHDTPNLPAGRVPRLTREQSRAQTRQRLLASAAVVFTREGYGGASCDRIAEEAGYSKGALYSNFASKEDVFVAMFEHYAKQEADALCQRLDAAGTAEQAIDTVSAWADGMRHEPDLRMLVLDMARRARSDRSMAERYTILVDAQWREVGTRLLKIFGAHAPPVPPLKLGALVMEIAYGNAAQLHAGVRSGELLGIALRALRASAGAIQAPG